MSSQYPFTTPPHAVGAPMLSPLRRQNAAQPPALRTTSLNNAQGLGLGYGLNAGQTPVSTTSLSSPFAVHSASPYPASSAVAASPMALRSPATFSAPYNPQQWGRIGSDGSPSLGSASTLSPLHARQSSRAVNYAPRLRGPDEPMSSPPPPYSADADGPSSADTISPSTDFSNGTTPSSATTTMSPDGAILSGLERRSPNPALIQSSSPAVAQTAFPPPPPASGTRIRSSSRNHADRLLAAMNLRPKNTNTVLPPNAIETLQHNTARALNQTDQIYNESQGPPAARRAASTGALGSSYSSHPPYTESPVLAEQGFAIPPPPPGPPPASTRSQSLCRPTDTYQSTSTPLVISRHRQPPGRGTGLGPVPPTPADWREDDHNTAVHDHTTQEAETNRPAWPGSRHVETESLSTTQHSEVTASADVPINTSGPFHLSRDSTGLIRSPAVRNRSSKGLRERRSESKNGKGHGMEDHESHAAMADALSRPLMDLVVSGSSGSLAGRRASTRLTPKSAKTFRGLDEALRSSESGPVSGSARSTPRLDSSRNETFRKEATQTPPFSLGKEGFHRQSLEDRASPYLRSKVAPTPPLQSSHRTGLASSLSVPPTSDTRPISHLLHMPNDDNVNIQVMPLSPESTQSSLDMDETTDQEGFARRAIERHRAFALQEAAAGSDSERLYLFIEHMVAESRIRRERYEKVFKEEHLSPLDLVNGMFDEPARDRIRAPLAELAQQSLRPDSRRSSGTSFADSQSHSRRPSTTATSELTQPVQPPVLPALDTNVNDSRRKDYVPCLSPIASMSAVTGRDEMDSRGRAPSRWWEGQSNSSNNGDGFKVLERSKRESKYMSAVLEHETTAENLVSYQEIPGSSQPPLYGPDEYPPEKTGLHDQPRFIPPPPPHPPTPMSAPYTPDPWKLDISRLITLPPPYPRHHPAVNNSHPDLADIRGLVRSLNDTQETDVAQESYEARVLEKRQRADSLCKHQKSLHEQDVQFRIEHGEISQQQFDEAEASLEAKMASSAKDLAQASFDLYQNLVVTPLHSLYSERIGRATSAFTALARRLHSDSQTHSPNLPQEAGDEQPELLEKLTMLKWLFETRESLHRDSYNLLSARNEKYKTIVLLPYKQAHNSEKLVEAEAFFSKDTCARKVAADKAALARWQDFHNVIEQHVTRGVEVQLSAFWDIAPPLQALLQRVPNGNHLSGFDILIPRAEVEENPTYWEHPLRYLYSVLAHAEASTKQFVDSQISLWCLLQEVREGAVGARWRNEESRVLEEGREDMSEWRWRIESQKGAEIKQGLDDLKERVAAVEGQWVEGLGGEIGRVRQSLRSRLEETRGWDEELESGG